MPAPHRMLSSEITVRFIISPSWHWESFPLPHSEQEECWLLGATCTLAVTSSAPAAEMVLHILQQEGPLEANLVSSICYKWMRGPASSRSTDENTVMLLHMESDSCILTRIIKTWKSLCLSISSQNSCLESLESRWDPTGNP